MDDHHARGDVGQAQRPIQCRIPAAGDDHALAAERLAAIHQIMHALVLELVDARQRRLVGPEGTHAGRHEHGLGQDFGAGRGFQRPFIARARELLDPLAEMIGGREGGGLRLELGDQLGRVDLGMAGNVVDRLFRIEGSTLPAREIERVDHVGLEFQHAAFEHGEEADGPRADDGDVGGVGLGHDRHTWLRPPGFSTDFGLDVFQLGPESG
jgi:hypothetical protein